MNYCLKSVSIRTIQLRKCYLDPLFEYPAGPPERLKATRYYSHTIQVISDALIGPIPTPLPMIGEPFDKIMNKCHRRQISYAI